VIAEPSSLEAAALGAQPRCAHRFHDPDAGLTAGGLVVE
jgi:hypothetical protein